ncbi:PLP-dependent cysteine synthase family protein [Thermostaphylospora chromogena]|uniref:PLP-dependent cysteine synthase family protein n=1 Tax=Thermostaphylospora chromogena TaxID=35622 RepID=UPI001F6111F2|nr:pyridoxal-phosphate dependent enzyme [Thermostaphylospora chromogena]
MNRELRLLDEEAAERRSDPVRLHRFPLPEDWGITLYLLDETANPTGSLKHRVARALFRHAIRCGRIGSGTLVIEATGGNAAVSQAYFARLLGLPFVAVMPRKSSPEKIERIERYGGTAYLVHPPLAIYSEARKLADEQDGHYMDYLTHGASAVAAGAADDDIGRVLFERLTVEGVPMPRWVVVGAGSGTTATTIGRYIRRHGLSTGLAVVDPENSAYFPGWVLASDEYSTGMPSRIEGIGRPRIEPSFTPDLVDLVIPVADAASLAAMRFLYDTTGLRGGGSTGTNLWGAFLLIAKMRREGHRGTVATLICDDGDLYRASYYDDAWLRGKGFDLAPNLERLREFMVTGELAG